MSDHLDFIHIYGFTGGDLECFQGLNSGSVTVTGSGGEETTTAVTLDIAPLVEALAPLQTLADLTPQPVDLTPILGALAPLQALADLTPQPVDLTPILEALAPLSHLERITELDLTDLLTRLEEIRDRMVGYDLSGIVLALEELRDRVADLAYVDQIIDFGFFRVHVKGKTIEY